MQSRIDALVENAVRRAEIAMEAFSWRGTPYRLRGQVKGPLGGVDCGTFLICVYRNCGFDVPAEHESTSSDWFCHEAGEKRYLRHMMKRCQKVLEGVCFRSLETQTGDILTTCVAGTRYFNHGAIVTRWPLAVHAIVPAVVEVDVTRDPMWATNPVEVWSPF